MDIFTAGVYPPGVHDSGDIDVSSETGSKYSFTLQRNNWPTQGQSDAKFVTIVIERSLDGITFPLRTEATFEDGDVVVGGQNVTEADIGGTLLVYAGGQQHRVQVMRFSFENKSAINTLGFLEFN